MDMQVDKRMVTGALGGTVGILILYYILKKEKTKYPPGPPSLPLVGCLPFMTLAGSVTKFLEISRAKYGDIFTFEIGGVKRVVVSGYKCTYDMIITNGDYTSTRSARSMAPRIQEFAKTRPGLAWAPAPYWVKLRNFAVNTLKEDGMGKSFLEPKIIEEVDQYIDTFVKPYLGKPIDMIKSLDKATINIVLHMLFSRRAEYDDKKVAGMISAVSQTVVLLERAGLVGNIPLIGSILANSTLKKEKDLSVQVIYPVLQSFIDERKNLLDPDNPRNMTDRLLISTKKAKTDIEQICFSEGNMLTVLTDFILGGASTNTAMRWTLLFMCQYPDVKRKVQREIDDIIGRDRTVTCKDRLQMRYTDAVLLETLRLASVAPILAPHTLDKDLVVDDVFVPEGADLMVNIRSVMHDKDVFEEPERFQPERYLTGDITEKKQRTIPFGLGKRACPAEGLGKMELFLFFVTFLQRFDMRQPLNAPPIRTLSGLANSPASYEIIFTERE